MSNATGTDKPTSRWRDVRWGVLWGLYLAAFFTVVAFVPATIRAIISPGTWVSKSVTFLEIIALYLCGGMMSGAIVGLLRNAARWWIGRRMIGIVAAIPIMLGVRIVVFGPVHWTRQDLVDWFLVAVIWGVAMSFAPEPWARGVKRK